MDNWFFDTYGKDKLLVLSNGLLGIFNVDNLGKSYTSLLIKLSVKRSLY